MTTRKVSERLDLYAKISATILLVTGVSAILTKKFNIGSYFVTCVGPYVSQLYATCMLDGANRLLYQNALPLLLAGLTTIWFFLYDWAIKEEKRLLDSILHVPAIDRKSKSIKSEYLVVFLAVAIPMLFLTLAWSVDRITIYCFLVVLLNLADLIGNNVVRDNLRVYIAEGDSVADSSPNRNFYYARRRVAEWYWLRCPHLMRVSLHLFINCAALFIATGQPAQIGYSMSPDIAYLLVALGIVLNEGTMTYWRYIRHRKLKGIVRMEETAIRATAN